MPRKSTPSPCKCLAVEATIVTAADFPELSEEEVANFIEYPIYGECGEMTKGGNFAPGHDAKLKSVLIQRHRAGMDYERYEGGLLVSGSPMVVAKAFGWEKFLQHEPKRRVRKERSEKAEGGEFPKVVRIKVGRWFYEGQLLSDGRVIYFDKKNNMQEGSKAQIVD